MKNIIFQYMITDDETEKRGQIRGFAGTRSELYNQVAQLSKKSFADYAKKIGATHHYSSNRVETKGIEGKTSLYFEVMRLVTDPIYDEYDKLLFCDTDIICNTSENIFNLMPDQCDVAGVLESEIVTQKGKTGYNSWDFKDENYDAIHSKYTRLGVPMTQIMAREGKDNPTPWVVGHKRNSRCFVMNTGMMIWSKEARLRARKSFDSWIAYMRDGEIHGDSDWVNNDQLYLSGQMMKHRFRVLCLNQTWNETPTHFQNLAWQNQNFLHYTGGDGKVELLKHYKNGLFKYVQPNNNELNQENQGHRIFR